MKTITTVQIPALKGTETIADSKDVFSYIDPDFKNYGSNEKGKATKKMTLEVQKMTEDATFEQMMSKDNLLTQEQILYFVKNHKDLLRQDGYATFFPFKSGDEVFVAFVGVYDVGRLVVVVRRFSRDDVWYAGYRRRVVVPKLKLRNSEKSLIPSGSLALDEIQVTPQEVIVRLESIEQKVDKLLTHLGIK